MSKKQSNATNLKEYVLNDILKKMKYTDSIKEESLIQGEVIFCEHPLCTVDRKKNSTSGHLKSCYMCMSHYCIDHKDDYLIQHQIKLAREARTTYICKNCSPNYNCKSYWYKVKGHNCYYECDCQ